MIYHQWKKISFIGDDCLCTSSTARRRNRRQRLIAQKINIFKFFNYCLKLIMGWLDERLRRNTYRCHLTLNNVYLRKSGCVMVGPGAKAHTTTCCVKCMKLLIVIFLFDNNLNFCQKNNVRHVSWRTSKSFNCIYLQNHPESLQN